MNAPANSGESNQLDVNGIAAVAAVRRAVARGASRAQLVRAATACARAVLPLVATENEDVVLAVEAAEQWATKGAPFDIQAALAAQFCGARILRPETDRLAHAEHHATLAAMMAASATLGDGSGEHSSVRAVEHAARVAPLLGVDVSVIVTAELL